MTGECVCVVVVSALHGHQAFLPSVLAPHTHHHVLLQWRLPVCGGCQVSLTTYSAHYLTTKSDCCSFVSEEDARFIRNVLHLGLLLQNISNFKGCFLPCAVYTHTYIVY